MKRRVANGGAAKLNRLELSDGRQRARAAHLDADIHEPRRRLACRELHGNCPSRRFRSAAQLCLQVDRIHLHHDAIDFVIEIVAMLFPVPVEIEDFLQRVAQLAVGIHLQAEPGNPLEIFRLQRFGRVNPVAVEIERPPGSDTRIQLA